MLQGILTKKYYFIPFLLLVSLACKSNETDTPQPKTVPSGYPELGVYGCILDVTSELGAGVTERRFSSLDGLWNLQGRFAQIMFDESEPIRHLTLAFPQVFSGTWDFSNTSAAGVVYGVTTSSSESGNVSTSGDLTYETTCPENGCSAYGDLTNIYMVGDFFDFMIFQGRYTCMLEVN